jgi:hypothetical protein
MYNYFLNQILEKTLLTGVSNENFSILDTDDFGIKNKQNYIILLVQDNINKKQLTFFVQINLDKNKKLVAYICKHKNKTLYETPRTKEIYDFFKLKYK